MITKCCSFHDMKKDILLNNSRVIMFGAGVIGRISVPEILKNYGRLEHTFLLFVAFL